MNNSPILFLARGHSGTRAVAQFLESCGVYMGTKDNMNETYDSILWTDLEREFVSKYFVCGKGFDYSLLSPRDFKKTNRRLDKHLKECKNDRWGFKTCGSMFAFEFYNNVFPNAKYIYLFRDGKDTILSHNANFHLSHKKLDVRRKFWQYFKVITFGLSGDAQDCGFDFVDDPENFPALEKVKYWIQAKSWVEHVRMMNCLIENNKFCRNAITIRYEDFCLNPQETTERLIRFLGINHTKDSRLFISKIHKNSVGKWKKVSGLNPVFNFVDREQPKLIDF